MPSRPASEVYEVRTHGISGARAVRTWITCIVASLLTRTDIVYAPLTIEIWDRERRLVVHSTKARVDSSIVETMKRDLASMTAEEFAVEWNLT